MVSYKQMQSKKGKHSQWKGTVRKDNGVGRSQREVDGELSILIHPPISSRNDK